MINARSFTTIVLLWFVSTGACFSSTVPKTVFSIDQSQDNHVIIKGQSTVNHWSCKTDKIHSELQVFIRRDRIKQLVNNLNERINVKDLRRTVMEISPPRPPLMNVSIPIRSFECGREAMNRDMYEALRADKQSNIQYMFYRIQSISLNKENQTKKFRLRTTGAIGMANVAQTVEFPVTITQEDDLSFRVSGSIDMKMTDFGVEPPTAFFGLIKAYDEITIEFTMNIKPGQSTQTIEAPEKLKEHNSNEQDPS